MLRQIESIGVMLLLIVGVSSLAAEELYVVKDFRTLEWTSGELPKDFTSRLASPGWWNGRRFVSNHRFWRVALEGDGEAYLSLGDGDLAAPSGNQAPSTCWLAIRVPARREIHGTAYLVGPRDQDQTELKFRIPADACSADQRVSFLRSQRSYYARLIEQGFPGTAWFRFREAEAARQLNATAKVPANRGGPTERFSIQSNPEDALAFFSGSRAIAENLQLDRVLPTTRPADPTVPLESVKGITVREFDWSRRIGGDAPPKDTLGALIPEDQYALFCPSFSDFVNLLDRADAFGTPVLYGTEDRVEDARVREQYQRQLCLPLSQIARLLGPALIQGVGVTGGDPDFRTGTDVALLFEPKSLPALREAILSRVALAAKETPDAQQSEKTIAGVPTTVWRSPDRSVSCYVAVISDTVVVANSPVQIQRLAEVAQGKRGALTGLPEYAFFRTQYPKGRPGESGFLIISDKTIRRWCGPHDRIAAGRRTVAAAVLSELQARHLDALVRGEIKDQKNILPDQWVAGADAFVLGPSGVRSSTYGSLAFQTPISELDFDRVTEEESTVYGRWRDGYERYWTNFFDPIAISVSSSGDRIATDLTVMPLIATSEYRRFLGLSLGASVKPTDGDPHPEALVHAVLALNRESLELQRNLAMGETFGLGNPLNWLGDHIAVYADEAPFWQEAAAAKDINAFMESNFHRLPVALHLDVRDGLRLTAFLAAFRVWIEKVVPGMIEWNTKEHNGLAYVAISPTARARASQRALDNAVLYYAASGESLVISPSEEILKRALDRQKAATADSAQESAKEKGPLKEKGEVGSGVKPWLGGNVCLRVSGKFVDTIRPVLQREIGVRMQQSAWNAIPILNEWKRRFPDRNPVEVHEMVWKRRLVSPAGGEYRWNPQAATMESVDYGFPGQPQRGPETNLVFRNLQSADFGLTFDEESLRVQFEWITKNRK